MKLFLDDIRVPKTLGPWYIARSFEEAVRYVTLNGIPHYISFDHDLGSDDQGRVLPTGYDFAKWLVDYELDGNGSFPSDFKFNIHSSNPIGLTNIESLLTSYLNYRSST